MRSVILADSSIKISSREDTAGEARTMVRSGRGEGDNGNTDNNQTPWYTDTGHTGIIIAETRPGVDKVKPKEGFSTLYRLTISYSASARLFHHVLFNMGDGRPAFGPSCTEFVYPECWHVAHEILVSALGPMVLCFGGLGLRGLGPGLDNRGAYVHILNNCLVNLVHTFNGESWAEPPKTTPSF